MNKLLAVLLREGVGIAAGRQLGKSLRGLSRLAVYYAIVTVFALASLAFLYVLIYEWLARLIGAEGAAALLCGINILVVAIMLIIRKASARPGRRSLPVVTGAMVSPSMEAGIALGKELGLRLRKTAPQIALAAAVIGLAIGFRPRIVGLGRKRRAEAPPPPKAGKRS